MLYKKQPNPITCTTVGGGGHKEEIRPIICGDLLAQLNIPPTEICLYLL